MTHRIDIKPLSVNKCWQGKRFKTPAYKAYEMEVLLKLPKIEIPDPPFTVHYTFGFSNSTSDIDNPCKLITDILSKKYGFNDKLIYRMILEREKVAKGAEFIEFSIQTFTN